MGSFSKDEELDELLKNVSDYTEEFHSVAFMVADYNGVREELKRVLSEKQNRRRDIWLIIAKLVNLDIHEIPGGRQFFFPRVYDVRFAVDVERRSMGSSRMKLYQGATAYLSVFVPSSNEDILSLLLQYAEEDARSAGYRTVFDLRDEVERVPEAFYLERGYARGANKDDALLRKCLGANVVYDHVLEKEL